LKYDPAYVKAYFRRGDARKKINMTLEALNDYKKVELLDPGFKIVKKRIAKMKKKIQKVRKKALKAMEKPS